ncbi:MAG: amidase [Proteobacteria bacterium]|nr:amidase [Pseudomonadota bacterium]
MNAELHYLTVAEAARLIAVRKLSPVELTRAFLARIEALNGKLDAFLLVTAERALAVAKAAEAEIARGRCRGALDGIPVALKDIFDTAGVRTTGHSRLYRDRVPREDSAVAARLTDAGAVPLGKTATHEFAIGGPSFDLPWPPARNPWKLDRFTGGSSSGSAAAVAAGLAPFAMGSDTGGSIRLPASYSGLAGLKPTHGRVSKRGVLPLSFTLDTVGPLCWTAEDCAIVLQAIAGYDPADPSTRDVPVPDFSAGLGKGVRNVRIGVVRHFYEEDARASEPVAAAMAEALKVLAGLGAQIRDVRLPPLWDFQASQRAIMASESFAIYGAELRARPQMFSECLRYRVMPGALLSGIDLVQALRAQRELSQAVLGALREVDVLVAPTTAAPAARLDQMPLEGSFADPSFTNPFNVCPLPTISICNGFSPDGLPVGMQVAGRPFDEAMVLRVADAYERASPWRQRRPDVEGQAKPALDPKPDAFKPVDPAAKAELAAIIGHAGLAANGRQTAALAESWPHVRGAMERLRRQRPRGAEPSHAVALPRPGGPR